MIYLTLISFFIFLAPNICDKTNDDYDGSGDLHKFSFIVMQIQELMDKLKMPSDAELMKIAIDDLNNSSTSLEDRQRALNELLMLVEPIDNANGKVPAEKQPKRLMIYLSFFLGLC